MKSILLKIKTTRHGDYVPPRAGAPSLSPEEEVSLLDSVERIVPESEEDIDKTELTTEATMTVEPDGRYCLQYEESELSGMEGTVTKLTFLDGDRRILTVIREGTTASTMVLEPGKFHTGLYKTLVMPLEMTTMTYSLTNTVTKDGGEITADYSLRLGGVTVNRTRLEILVTVR